MADARQVVLDALTGLSGAATLEEALERAGLGRLEARDRGFSYLLAMQSLRWGRAADAVLARYIADPVPEKKSRVRWALRMGVVQLGVLRTPAHAAVSTTVDLLKQQRADKGYAPLANAVLKRIAQENPALDASAALPEWLAARWQAAYGKEALAAIAPVIASEPPLDLTLREEAAAGLVEGERLGAHSLRVPLQDVASLPGYSEGAWWVQDVAATLPVQMLGEVKGRVVLDACAAPGGKTAQLCASGAEVVALDRSAVRLKRLRENMERLRFAPQIVQADVLRWVAPRYFDAILLDAPCSATGTLRRHPEIGWVRGAEEVAKLASAQQKLLERVWEWLAPGGRLVYSTCSLEQEEGEDQVRSFLARHPEAALEHPPLPAHAIPEGAFTPEGMLRILPSHWSQRGGVDGFFAACLTKR